MGQSEFPLMAGSRRAMIGARRRGARRKRRRGEERGGRKQEATRAPSLVAPKLSPAFLPGFGGKSRGQPLSMEDLEREAFMRGEGGGSKKRRKPTPRLRRRRHPGGRQPERPDSSRVGVQGSKSLFDSLTSARKAEAIVSVTGLRGVQQGRASRRVHVERWARSVSTSRS